MMIRIYLRFTLSHSQHIEALNHNLTFYLQRNSTWYNQTFEPQPPSSSYNSQSSVSKLRPTTVRNPQCLLPTVQTFPKACCLLSKPREKILVTREKRTEIGSNTQFVESIQVQFRNNLHSYTSISLLSYFYSIIFISLVVRILTLLTIYFIFLLILYFFFLWQFSPLSKLPSKRQYRVDGSSNPNPIHII